MKRICTRCQTIASDDAHWCQNQLTKCPPGTLTLAFDPDEMLNDIKIVSRLQIFRTAVLYRGVRGKKSILVKVAHKDCHEQLKLEAFMLRDSVHPALPTLLSAEPEPIVQDRIYNRMGIRGELKYYLVYKDIPKGEFLDEILKHNAQPEMRRVFELMIGLADAVAYFHSRRETLVLNIHPGGVMVRYDKQGIPRPVLIDLGMLSNFRGLSRELYLHYGSPAYLAPEQIRGQFVAPGTDIYSLGLVLYEMLAGQPAFPHRVAQDETIHQQVLNSTPISIFKLRPDLNVEICHSIQQAMDKTVLSRQPDINTFTRPIRHIVILKPEQRRLEKLRPGRRAAAIFVFSMFILFIISFIWLFISS